MAAHNLAIEQIHKDVWRNSIWRCGLSRSWKIMGCDAANERFV